MNIANNYNISCDLVLVFDRDQKAYQEFIAHLQPQKLPEFGGEGLTLEAPMPRAT